jgi:hypothetical protein
MLVITNPFHGPTASRAEFASNYVLLALQIPFMALATTLAAWSSSLMGLGR